MQTSYKLEMDPALVGQLADLSCNTIDSFSAEEALTPGILVKYGTNPEKQVLACDANDDVTTAVGVVIHEHKEPSVGSEKYYPVNYTVGVLTKGRIWVKTGGKVTAGKAANYKVAAGAFVEDEVTTGIEAVPQGAKFITSTASAGLAIVELG